MQAHRMLKGLHAQTGACRVVASHGSCNWAHIASEFNAQMGREGNAVTARTGKQCRERFMHHLRPDIQTVSGSVAMVLRLAFHTLHSVLVSSERVSKTSMPCVGT